jgi:hypothetical protein
MRWPLSDITSLVLAGFGFLILVVGGLLFMRTHKPDAKWPGETHPEDETWAAPPRDDANFGSRQAPALVPLGSVARNFQPRESPWTPTRIGARRRDTPAPVPLDLPWRDDTAG